MTRHVIVDKPTNTSPRSRRIQRGVLALALGLVAVPIGLWSPAEAALTCDASIINVTTLQAAVDAGGTVALCQNVTSSNQGIVIPPNSSVILDLNGNTLNLTGGTAGGGQYGLPAIQDSQATLTIEDTNGRGVLIATAGSGTFNGAAIGGDSLQHSGGSQDGGTLTISNASVIANASPSGAAIGGGENGNGGIVTISQATVAATCVFRSAAIGGGQNGSGGTLNINNGASVTANGCDNAAAIGGGENGSGGTINISTSNVIASVGNNQGTALGGGYQDAPVAAFSAAAFGVITNNGSLDIVGGAEVVPAGATFTNGLQGQISVAAAGFTGGGIVVNNGLINGSAAGASVTPSDSTGVTVYDYYITYDTTADPTGPTPASQHVYAQAYTSLTTQPAPDPGYVWSTKASGGVAIDRNTDFSQQFGIAGQGPMDVTLYEAPLENITFDSGVSAQSIIYGNTLTKPTDPTRAGYYFAGWSTSQNGSTGLFDFTTKITSSFSLYAQWEPDLALKPAGGSAMASPTVLPSATVGHYYSQAFTTSGGAGTPYTLTKSTSIPGLTLSSGGILSGSATVPTQYTFSVTATDAQSHTITQWYVLTVNPSPISFTPTSLPAGTIGGHYAQTITASGDNSANAYTYSVTTGSLPNGLNLNTNTGALTGSPTAVGSSTFTVTAAGQQVVPCSINPHPGQPCTNVIPTGYTNTQAYAITVNGIASQVSPNPVTFSNAPLNAATTQNIPVLLDPGYDSLQVGTQTNANFSVALGTCDPTTRTCTLEVSFTPSDTAAQNGSTAVSECNTTDNICNPLTNSPLTESGTGTSSFAAKPSPIDFGAVHWGNSSDQTITVALDNGYDVSSVTASDPMVTSTPCMAGLSPCTMIATAAPTAQGAFKGTLTIKECPAIPTSSATCQTIAVPYSGNTANQVSFDLNGGSGTAPATQWVTDDGSTATQPAVPTRTDYTFSGWYTAATGGNLWHFTTPIAAAVPLYAQWKITNPVTVSFNSENGTPTPSSQTIPSGTTAAAPTAPALADHTFDGWFTAATGGTKFDFTQPVTTNTPLFAQWSITHPVIVSFNAENGAPTPGDQTLPSGATATAPSAPTLANYTFDGWFTAATGGVKFDFTTPVSANTPLFAQWSITHPVTVTFNSEGGSTTPLSQTLVSGTTAVAPSAPTSTGRAFDGWYTAAIGGSKFDFSQSVTADVTLYAQWTGVSLKATSVTQGATLAGTGTGFQPGEKVRATLHSTSLNVGTFTADSQGNVAITAKVPGNFTVGNHTLTLVGETSQRSAAAALVVSARPTISTPSHVHATAGQKLTVPLTASGPGAKHWSVSGHLPPGIHLVGNTLTGTPTTPGTYTFQIAVNGVTSRTVTLTIIGKKSSVVPSLPDTGGPNASILWLASGLVALGGVMMAGRRRRA